MKNFSDHLKEELVSKIGDGEFQFPLFFEKPISISSELRKKFLNQKVLIDDFFRISTSIARQSLNSPDSRIKKILFSEPIGGMDVKFHRDLPDCCWNNPIMYRTDQSISGKIYEVQCPGSGWGDFPLFANAFKCTGIEVPPSILFFAKKYAKSISVATQKEIPKVFHMLDASSSPSGMKYLFTQTRPSVKYWGLDKGFSMSDVDYLTAHSSASLITSNFYKSYLSKAIKGDIVFGIPPNLVIDQKAIYLLPFHRDTAEFFSNDIRNLFPFTTLIENNGFLNSYGQFITIEEFSKMHKKDRGYYLKYGGPDLNRNWGSRAVYRLSGNDCKKLLLEASIRSRNGEVWLIQEDVSQNELINTSIDLREIKNNKFHVKLSAFHSNIGMLGIKIMARKHFKVHGQHDTYVGIAE
jgi:hypothetical protein